MKTYRDKARVICHALRMSSLSGVDPDKILGLSSRIKALPPPEKIASMSHGDSMELTKRLERLIFDIGNSKTSRTVDYAIKHRIDKGIPPRLSPVLGSGSDDWMTRAAQEEMSITC